MSNVRIRQTARKSTTPHQRETSSTWGSILSTKRNADQDTKNNLNLVSENNGRGKYISSVKIRPRYSTGEAAMKEIRRLQRSTDLQLPRSAFQRIVREITQEVAQSRNVNGTEYKYQAFALLALQEAAEAFLVRMFEDSYMCTNHAKRVTLFPSDIALTRRLQRW